MRYMSIAEASKKWQISDRRIRVLCVEGRIEGAVKFGRNWSIPNEATKPSDARISHKKSYKGITYDFSKIDEMKKKIDQYRPFSKRLADSLRDKLIIEWTYNSNAIEGSTLTLGETIFFLQEGLTIEGKPFKDFLDARNHAEAIDLLFDVIAQKRSRMAPSTITLSHHQNSRNAPAFRHGDISVLC